MTLNQTTSGLIQALDVQRSRRCARRELGMAGRSEETEGCGREKPVDQMEGGGFHVLFLVVTAGCGLWFVFELRFLWSARRGLAHGTHSSRSTLS